MSANDQQVGGGHYKTGTTEHWDWVEDQGVGYLEGCATKYVARFRDKGGRQDLEKAIHFVEKLLELYRDGSRRNRSTLVNPGLTERWLEASRCGELQREIIMRLLLWSNGADLMYAAGGIRELIGQEYPA